ncbi:class I SAM-dependent methyltransferase [Candidatus Microthrix parvicella]|uniref:class I SAM-dependent methyltransferase n=1 Tax=Candidatus Neomicrothrix parvicella TaxID=41950 RepID=UPI0003713884|nr:class I SAM-dependent methyltransferase [Candidatus Microthrix parvicella]
MIDVGKDLPKKLDDVPGWLSYGDQLVFQWLLEWQSRTQEPSDLVEVGVYKGKSAIHLGRFLRDGERLTVCDLFDVAGSEETIRDDVRRAYASLSQDEFESNYLAFHDELPEIIRGLSSLITDHVSAGSCRLVHIDASHMYEHVRGDTFAAKEMLRQDGIVVFDDYRTEHTVGTAAAVWEAIANDGLNPIACTAMKLYATWGDPVPAQNEIRAQVSQRTDYKLDPVFVQRDLPVLRVVPAKKPRPAAAPASENSVELRKIAEEALAKATEALAKTSGGGRIERLARKVRARIKK